LVNLDKIAHNEALALDVHLESISNDFDLVWAHDAHLLAEPFYHILHINWLDNQDEKSDKSKHLFFQRFEEFLLKRLFVDQHNE
jgi:hypothetical protein